MRSLVFLLVVSAAGVVGCGGAVSPMAPTPLGPPSVPTTVAVDTVTGATIGNPTVTRSGSRVTVEATGYLTRETSAASHVDLIPTAAPFDLAFYRIFVRNAYEAPTELQIVRRQESAPNFYIRTVDEAGATVPTALVDLAAAVMGTVDAYTGARFTTASVERGPETREGQRGWITVKWLAGGTAELCGRAAVGGTWLELNYQRSNCQCNGRLRPRTMRHELGHAMGFWHTGSADDLMSGLSVAACETPLSARERFHAALAYKRPVGNRDIDVDPLGVTSFAAPAAVVID